MAKRKVCFTLSKSILDELNYFSEELGERKSCLVEKALDYYFSCVDFKMTEASVESVENGEETYSFEDVFEKDK